jgi:hypothetical protein
MRLSILFLVPQVALTVALVKNEATIPPWLSSSLEQRKIDSADSQLLISRAVDGFNYESNSANSKSTQDFIDKVLDSLGVKGKTKDAIKKGVNSVIQNTGQAVSDTLNNEKTASYISNTLKGFGINVNEGEVSGFLKGITGGGNVGNGNAGNRPTTGNGILDSIQNSIQNALSNMELNAGAYNLGQVFGLPKPSSSVAPYIQTNTPYSSYAPYNPQPQNPWITAATQTPYTPYPIWAQPQYTQSPQWNQPQYTQSPQWNQPQYQQSSQWNLPQYTPSPTWDRPQYTQSPVISHWTQTWDAAPSQNPSTDPYLNNRPNSNPVASLPPWIDSGSQATGQYQSSGYQPNQPVSYIPSPSWVIESAADPTPTYNAYSGYSGNFPTQNPGWEPMDTISATPAPAPWR